jgi:Ca2+-binding EF-hand superfamily protein
MYLKTKEKIDFPFLEPSKEYNIEKIEFDKNKNIIFPIFLENIKIPIEKEDMIFFENSNIEKNQKKENKSKNNIEPMVFRNYASDTCLLYKEVYNYMCEAFDLYQKDGKGVPKSKIFTYIMKKSRGRCNPMILNELLKEFEVIQKKK